jgi:hypothetical protein
MTAEMIIAVAILIGMVSLFGVAAVAAYLVFVESGHNSPKGGIEPSRSGPG